MRVLSLVGMPIYTRKLVVEKTLKKPLFENQSAGKSKIKKKGGFMGVCPKAFCNQTVVGL